MCSIIDQLHCRNSNYKLKQGVNKTHGEHWNFKKEQIDDVRSSHILDLWLDTAVALLIISKGLLTNDKKIIVCIP
jgi:hypothetical protein